MKPLHRILALGSACLLLGLPARSNGAESAAASKTALDAYVAKPDPTYSWKLVKTIPADGCTTFVLNLTSQSWRTVPEVDRAVWQHWLVIVKPEQVNYDTAYLRIGGGRNGNPIPEQPNPQLLRLAKSTN